jgi:uncharacterized protein (TIGR03086 family)
MTDVLDLAPATRELARLVRGTADDQLGGPTPCPAYTVADLVDHVQGLTLAFTHAATKQALPPAEAEAGGDGSRLSPDFREEVAAGLEALALAWAEPSAYDGITQAGPVELPGEVAAAVALNEVVVHAWDLAVATAQPYDADPTAVAVCTQFVASFEPPADGPADAPADDGGLFGPPVPVADDADPVSRLVALAGRRPDWTP